MDGAAPARRFPSVRAGLTAPGNPISEGTEVRLSSFIRDNVDGIVDEWETFARSLDPEGTMGITELRDHAKEMLLVIAHDLDTAQSEREGSKKARGESDATGVTHETPAQAHGTGRAGSGYDVAEMVSEYRALRASVIRLWTKAEGRLEGGDIEDLVRFSEAIDQALAESTDRFMRELDRTRDIFLGVLGHDLRTPLGAMITAAQFILEVEELSAALKMARIVVSSGTRMDHMVDDLLDFTRGRFGTIPVVPTAVDLGEVLRASVEEFESARPGVKVELQMEGDLQGEWDGPRLSQVWSNLLGNAADHGVQGTPIRVAATSVGDEVVCSVHNVGPRISKDRLRNIFKPLVTDSSGARGADHLGLGLFIVEQIVKSHRGRIHVESDAERGTTFLVHLPRRT